MSPNTLRLLHDLLCRQQILASAPRNEIEAVLAAREELEAAIAEAAKP
jgi:hypothetical protein